MTLGFSQEIKGVKNFFVEKIWASLLTIDYDLYSDYLHPDGRPALIHSASYYKDFQPKHHTIRQGIGRWRAGMDIHMVINNRTKNRFQFAPTIKCKSVQQFSIEWNNDGGFVINIDKVLFVYQPHKRNSIAHLTELERLAVNDGFDSAQAFLDYFNKDFTGTLIHWTDLKY